MATNDGAVAAKTTTTPWEEVLGSKNWEGLLNPLDLDLRNFVLCCGDFCQCSYDALDADKSSANFGTSRYGKTSFFNKVKFEFAADYQVSSLLYTTSSLEFIVTLGTTTNFQGFVATSTDALAQQRGGLREIFISWRGTVTRNEWAEDIDFKHVSTAPILSPYAADPSRVHKGFLDIYIASNPNSPFTDLSARDQLHAKINELREKYKGETLSIVVIGHSLGGALAVLSAFDLVENVVKKDIPVTAVTFGGPRVGDAKFKERVEQHINLHILRVVNKLDLVPRLPLQIMGYVHVGVELKVDGVVSPHLKTVPDSKWDWHNLQGMLHVVAGWQGKNAAFNLVVKRSLALVNKSSNFLKKEHKIPASWWEVENKGMILNEKGEWVLAPYELDPTATPLPQRRAEGEGCLAEGEGWLWDQVTIQEFDCTKKN